MTKGGVDVVTSTPPARGFAGCQSYAGVGRCSPLGCVSDFGGGLVPAVLEGLEETSLDLGRYVGVGVLDRIFDLVAEAFCLGDLRDVVGDHPGFVAVAQTVEGEAGLGGFESGAGVVDVEIAVGAGADCAAAEVAASVEGGRGWGRRDGGCGW